MRIVTKRLIVWAIIITFILLIPLIAMQFSESVNWDLADFAIMGALLFGAGLAYELIANKVKKGRKVNNRTYKAAFGIGLTGAFLLVWVNGAVGIIGREDNPANLLYGAVFAVGFIGSLIARFKPHGMAYTLFAAALIQILVPVFALFVWPAQASWGEAGVIGVFVFNSIFAMVFVASAMLFHKVARKQPPTVVGVEG